MNQSKDNRALTIADEKPSALFSIRKFSDIEIARNGWAPLVKSGQFDHSQAAMAMDATSKSKLAMIQPKSIEHAVAMPTASFTTVRKYKGEVTLNAVLHQLIYNLVDFFSVGMAINDAQIETLQRLVYMNYHWMTVAEFTLFVQKAQSGDFGQVYNRLDGATIMSWLSGFASEVLECRAQKPLEQHARQKRESESAKVPDFILEFVRQLEQKTSVQKTSFVHTTLEGYCRANHIDFDQYAEKLLTGFKVEYAQTDRKMNEQDFLAYKLQAHLLQLNYVTAQGDVVFTRRMTPNERQATIFKSINQ